MQKAANFDLPLPLQHSIAACCSIIREYFAPRTNSFMLSTHIEKDSLYVHMKDFLNQVLLCLNMIKVEIEDLKSEYRMASYNRKYNLIVVDSPEALRRLNPAYLTRNYDIQEYYLLYLLHASRFDNIPEKLQEIFKYFWQNNIINVSVMEVNQIDQSVEVFTYYPFHGQELCKMVYMKMINIFSGSWLYSLDKLMFPEKIWNLHQCPLTVAVWNTPPYLSYFRTPTGFYEISDFEADMLKVLAEKLNFTFDLKEPSNNEQRGRILQNGSTTGAIRMLQQGLADLSLGSFRYTIERTQQLTAALPYYQTWQIYGVRRRGNPYNSLQILFYAFDARTWLCVYLSLQLAAILTYKIELNYNRSILARIILGFPRTTSPITNIVRLFMGQSMIKLPQTNFTRYMIALWLLYGTVLRTGYQSLLFQLLRGNLYHTPPQTLTELIAYKCKLVMTEVTYDSVGTVPRIAQGLIELVKLRNNSELSSFAYVATKKRECYAGVAPQDFLAYYALIEKKIGIFYILPEKIFTQHVTMYFTKHSYLINRFNLLFMNLRSMGLIDFWATKILDPKYFRSKQDVQFKAISLTSLSGIFLIYVVLLLVAVIIFCMELSFEKIRWWCCRSRAKIVK